LRRGSRAIQPFEDNETCVVQGHFSHPRPGAGEGPSLAGASRREKGELPASADPAVLAQLASATVHTIAIRARARVPRKELEAIVKGALDVMLRG